MLLSSMGVPSLLVSRYAGTSILPKAHVLNQRTMEIFTELVGIEQDAEGVTATVLDRDMDERYRVRCAYLLGADGGRTVGDFVGIGMSGPTNLMRMVSTHMTADLSAYLDDPDVLIRWLVNPDFGGSWASGVLVAMGPERWGPDSEEWVFHLQYAVDDADALRPEKVLDRIRATLGIPDFAPITHRISRWVMEGVLADEFRAGRVFLLGHAAHRHPPTGGLGLNSAVHDAYNLCWKIAAVLAGRAGAEILDTYGAERRPVDAANIDAACKAAMNHYTIDQALGLSPDKSPEDNWAEVRPLWEDLPGSADKRHALTRAIGSQTIEFRHHNVEFGCTYRSSAVVDDGSAPYVPLDPVRLYEPSTKPGHPLPHAWVEREGERLALGTLVDGGHFVLIAGEEGQAWVDAAEKLAAEHGIPLRAATVGVLDSDYVDVRCSWLKHRGISPEGAVLVRPDRYIGFRSLGPVDDPQATLASAFGDTGAPVPRRGQVFAIGLTYRAPAAEAGFDLPDAPPVFTKFVSSFTGPTGDIVLAGPTVDWEVELVAVIGRRARHVPPE